MTDIEKFIKENGIKRGPTKVAKGYGAYRAPKPGIKMPTPKYEPSMKHYSKSDVPWLKEQQTMETKETDREINQVTTKTQIRHKKAI